MKPLPIAPARRLQLVALASALVLAPIVATARLITVDGKVKISSNENVWSFSPKALERVKEELVTGNYYNRDEIAEFNRLCAASALAPRSRWTCSSANSPRSWAKPEPAVHEDVRGARTSVRSCPWCSAIGQPRAARLAWRYPAHARGP